MAQGTYTGTVTATSGGRTATLSVTMTLSRISLVFTPSSLAPTAQADAAPVALATQSTASNASARSLTVTDNQSWLTVSPASGTTPATLTVTANPAGLAPSVYNGTVTAANETITKTLGVAGAVTVNAHPPDAVTSRHCRVRR